MAASRPIAGAPPAAAGETRSAAAVPVDTSGAALELFDGEDGASSAAGDAPAPSDVSPTETMLPPAGLVGESPAGTVAEQPGNTVAEPPAGYSPATLPRLGWSGHVFALDPEAATESPADESHASLPDVGATASEASVPTESRPDAIEPPRTATDAAAEVEPAPGAAARVAPSSDTPAAEAPGVERSDNGRPLAAGREHPDVTAPAAGPVRDPILTRAVARARAKREEAEGVTSDGGASRDPRKAGTAQPASDGRDAGKEPGFDLDARYEEAKALAKAGDYARAIDVYHEVLRRDPSNVRARNNLGFAYDARGAHDLAITEYLQALELDPRNVQVLCNLGGVYGTKGWYPKAEEALKGALRIDPKSAEAHCNLGIVYCKKGLYHLATAELKRAIELDAGFVQAFYYLGECYNHLDRVDDAIESFERSLQAQPSNAKAYYNLGILFDKKNMPDRAMRMYRRARDLQGNPRGA